MTVQSKSISLFYYHFRGLSRGKTESVFIFFTKFNVRKMDSSLNLLSFMFTFSGGRPTYPPFFLGFKNVPCPFSTISRTRKPDSCLKLRNVSEKYAFEKFLLSKTADFAPKRHFVSRWRNIY